MNALPRRNSPSQVVNTPLNGGNSRMQTESVEHGRGQGLLRHYTFRKFKEVPKAVLFMNQPRSQSGAFEPTDRLLTPG